MKTLNNLLKSVVPYSVVETSWKRFTHGNQTGEGFATVYRQLPWEGWKVLDRGSECTWSFDDEFDFFPIQPKKTYDIGNDERWYKEVTCSATRYLSKGELIETATANLYIYEQPVEGQDFQGREEALQRLKNFWLSESPPLVWVHGQPAIGKTSLIYNVARECPTSEVKVVYCNLEWLKNSPQKLGEFLTAIAVSINKVQELPSPHEISKDLLEIPSNFQMYLEEVESHLQGNLIIILDNIDRLLSPTSQENTSVYANWLTFLLECASSKISFTLVSSHSPERMHSHFPALNLLTSGGIASIEIGFLSRGESDKLLTRIKKYTPEALIRIYNLTNGHPFLLQIIGNSLAHYNKNDIFTLEQVNNLLKKNDLFILGSWYFNRLYSKPYCSEEGQKILRVLSATKEGYTSGELSQSSLIEADYQLRELRELGIVQQRENKWYIKVELLRLKLQSHPKERNPYSPNAVAVREQFQGREDVLQQLKELWIGEEVQSTLIYGQRRIGKSSLIHNAAHRFNAEVKIAYLNLQILGSPNSEEQAVSEFLLAITDSIAEVTAIKPPLDKEMLEQPYEAFRSYLAIVEEQLKESLIIALDEFESLPILIREGKLPDTFPDYLQECISAKIGFVVIAGHSPEEMFRTYLKNFFDKLISIQIKGFLSLKETRAVLTQFRDYTDEVSGKIHQLTHGQPLLVQIIGFMLTSRYPKVELFTYKQLEEILTEGKIFDLGSGYFSLLWSKISSCLAFQKVIVSLADEKEGLTSEELRIKLDAITRDISDNLLSSSLTILEEKEIIENKQEKWMIAVELFRIWLLGEKPHHKPG